jgi:hypothetical protein
VSRAATDAGLKVERSGGLRRQGGEASIAVVHIRLGDVEWTGEKEARVAFAYAVDANAAVPCSVLIRLDSGWAYHSEGEEHCWPRPSPKR